MIVVSIKYVAFIMRADNKGEGGIMALMALVLRGERNPARARVLMLLGLFGAALFYGDGIDHARDLGALRRRGPRGRHAGVQAVRHSDHARRVAAAVRRPEARHREASARCSARSWSSGSSTLAVLGVIGIAARAAGAGGPQSGVRVGFLARTARSGSSRWARWCSSSPAPRRCTRTWGISAADADPHRVVARSCCRRWRSTISARARCCSAIRKAVENPFYLLAPAWALYPLVALATVATIIASQAVISGAYSITQQAMQLGYAPRMEVQHTSGEQIGQIYLPGINWTLFVGVVALVLGFGSSTSLAAAYGIAVTGTMAITTVLAFVVARADLAVEPARRASRCSASSCSSTSGSSPPT